MHWRSSALILGLAGVALAVPAGLRFANGSTRPAGWQASGPPSWPIFRGDPGLQGIAPGTLPDSLELLWTFETEAAITSSPVVADGLVYFGSDDTRVYAVELETGAKLWSFATEDIVEAPPLVHRGTVYVGSSDFFFYALDANTGELRWKYETDDKILGGANWFSPPDGGSDRILVGSYDTQLYCFDADTGAKLWTYKTDNYVNGTPALLGERVIFGGCDAVLHVVSAATGEPLSRVELGGDCHVAGSVALADGAVYFGHYGNEFVCIDLESGETRWSYGNPQHAFFSSPAIGTERVVFGGRDKQLHCVDRASGEPVWTFRTRRKVDGSPVIAGDKVVFGSGDGRLYVLGLADGEELWAYDIGRSIFASPAVVGGMVLIGGDDGLLYAFGSERGGG